MAVESPLGPGGSVHGTLSKSRLTISKEFLLFLRITFLPSFNLAGVTFHLLNTSLHVLITHVFNQQIRLHPGAVPSNNDGC